MSWLDNNLLEDGVEGSEEVSESDLEGTADTGQNQRGTRKKHS